MQIQNAGTLCGNLCNASPAADGTPNLLALDASVELSSARATRRLPVAEFVTGSRAIRARPEEMVTAVVVPKPKHESRSTFLKLGARKYLVISIVMVARCRGDRPTTTRSRARASRSDPAPLWRSDCRRWRLRSPAASSMPGSPTWRGPSTWRPLSPIDDVRGTAAYRRDAALTLVRRAITGLIA